MKHIALALRTGAAIAAIVAGASAAQAQSTLPPADAPETPASTAQEATSQGDIIVTGSRIRRDPLSQDAPITFVDEEDIAKTGLNSINDVLQRLPSAGGGLNGKFNNSGNFGNPPDGGGVGAGSAEIDLRYLGSKRTLVLVDGLRFVNGAAASGVPGSVDLNAIPESMIERVEVLQDGASSIYGSDAIAGVVNIITKKRQRGFLASAQLGINGEGDGFSQNYQVSWGNGGDGPTQIVVGANYVKQQPISSGDRDISLFPNPYSTDCGGGGCSSGTPLGRFIVLGQDLTLIAPVIGRAPVLADYRAFSSPGDRFNFAPFNFILTPLERLGAFANLKHEIAPDLNFSAKLMWNRRKSKNQAAPLPLFVGPDAGNGNLLDTIVIDASNPFNPFGTLGPGTYEFIGRRVIEGGPRRYNQTVNTTYGTATLDGRFDMMGREWFWDINGLVGRNKAKQVMLGNINAANLQLALGPVGACVAPCVPFNIFGGVGSITQAMLDYVGFEQNDRSKQKLWGVTANLSGSLMDLPGGPLGLAVGVEHRDQKGSFTPDPIIQAGLGSDIPAQASGGGFNIDEAYAEINAPVIADRPFFELLEFSGAVRFSDYSSSGSTTTFKGGVNWKPVRDLRLRGSWAQGFRAPTIGELFGTPSRFDQELADPCSADQNPSGTIAANCATLGVPVGYQQNNPQISVLTSGNEDLKPEKSKGYNLGAVYSPSFLPRFSIEADYYNIKIKNAIFAAAGEVLARCVSTLDPVACAAVTRTASGQIAQISGVLGNVNGINTKGLDVNLAYKTAPASWGTLGFTFNNTFLFNYDVIVPTADGSAVIDREGTEQGSPDQAYPKHKAIAILDWNGKNVGASLTGRYIKKVVESANGNDLNSRLYTDIQLRFFAPSFADNFGFALGINNLFDKDPPGCISCGLNNYDPGTYDVPGRYFYARATLKM
ncbi:TonB-dependent receptor [Sphingomonas sp.]|uniref:TonB-dependent receptor n=1 Tax=Sphingomonas sp. TaxID=28214 RepID=UPI00286EB0E7|nr:TonB-dependent receptor [Sphingomonas sp.]